MQLFLGLAILILALALDICHGAEPQSVRRAGLDFNGNLTVDVIEAGEAAMNYQLTAEVVAVYQCLLPSGACPSAVNRQEMSVTVAGNATLKANTLAGPLQGLVSGRVVALAPTETLVCVPGEEVTTLVAGLMTVRYEKIMLHNMTQDTVGGAYPLALGATLRTCP